MAAFGDELRKERERRGRSLDWLSSETKVNPRYLEALERGDFHELPGGVFRRGIVRSYVGCLGLAEAEWVNKFEAIIAESAKTPGAESASGDESWSTFALNVKRSRVRQKRSHGLRWMGVALMVILLAGAGWAVWVFELRELTSH